MGMEPIYTAYELADLANTHVANASDDINRVLVFFSAYLVTAYTAGASLTRLQVSIINVGFFAIVLAFSFGALGETQAAIAYYDKLAGRSGEEHLHDMELVQLVITPLMIVAFLASYSFMWSVRHPKTE
jgi:hypothetical protein